MKKTIVLALVLLLLVACSNVRQSVQNLCTLASCEASTQSVQTAVAQTQSVWTTIPTQTAYPTFTPQPTIVVTRVVVRTPVPSDLSDRCKPITNMDYSDRSKMMAMLRAYVAGLPDVKSVSYIIPEKVYVNTQSELFFVNYVSSSDGELYSKRYIVYVSEFGWKKAVFSIDGQCWIDPP